MPLECAVVQTSVLYWVQQQDAQMRLRSGNWLKSHVRTHTHAHTHTHTHAHTHTARHMTVRQQVRRFHSEPSKLFSVSVFGEDNTGMSYTRNALRGQGVGQHEGYQSSKMSTFEDCSPIV